MHFVNMASMICTHTHKTQSKNIFIESVSADWQFNIMKNTESTILWNTNQHFKVRSSTANFHSPYVEKLCPILTCMFL